jgi:hypothetical protein
MELATPPKRANSCDEFRRGNWALGQHGEEHVGGVLAICVFSATTTFGSTQDTLSAKSQCVRLDSGLRHGELPTETNH